VGVIKKPKPTTKGQEKEKKQKKKPKQQQNEGNDNSPPPVPPATVAAGGVVEGTRNADIEGNADAAADRQELDGPNPDNNLESEINRTPQGGDVNTKGPETTSPRGKEAIENSPV
jgi:hypothetical protein